MSISLMDYETMYELLYKLDHVAMACLMRKHGFSVTPFHVSGRNYQEFFRYLQQIAFYYGYFEIKEADDSCWLVFKQPNKPLMDLLDTTFSYERISVQFLPYTDSLEKEPLESLSISFDDCENYRKVLQCFLEALEVYALEVAQKGAISS